MTIDDMIYALAVERDPAGPIKYTARVTEEELLIIMAALELYISKNTFSLTACQMHDYLKWVLS